MRLLGWGTGIFLLLVLSAGVGAAQPNQAAMGSFAPDARVGLDAAQLAQAARTLTVADKLNTPPLAVLSMVVAALGESEFRVVPNGQGTVYCGVFQADPAAIPCGDTEEQAKRFLLGGKGFQQGGAIALSKQGLSPGCIAWMVEASDAGCAHYQKWTAKAQQIIAAWRRGGPVFPSAPVAGSPKQIVDSVVLPLANSLGVARTVAENDAANARHGPTVSGGRSDHQGPPDEAWAADMSNGSSPTPEMDRLAAALAERFDIPWDGAGDAAATHDGVRYQLLYRTMLGGNHFNHVHFGVRVSTL